jgi:hypothetical protein
MLDVSMDNCYALHAIGPRGGVVVVRKKQGGELDEVE